jgi:hypothetical protein
VRYWYRNIATRERHREREKGERGRERDLREPFEASQFALLV